MSINARGLPAARHTERTGPHSHFAMLQQLPWKMLGDNRYERRYVKWLRHVIVATGIQAFLAIFGCRVGGQRHDRVGISSFPQLPSCFVAVHDRHLDVHQNDIEGTVSLLCCQGKIDGNLSIFCHRNVGSSFSKYMDDQRWLSRPSSTSRIRQFSLLPMLVQIASLLSSESQSGIAYRASKLPVELENQANKGHGVAKSRAAQEKLGRNQGGLIKVRWTA